MDYNILKDCCDNGLSQQKIAVQVGKSQTTVVYWLKKFNLRTKRRRYWDELEFRQAIINSTSIRQVLLKMGKNESTSAYNRFHRNVEKYNIDTSHLLSVSSLARKRGRLNIKNENIFIADSPYSRGMVKRRIIADNLVDYKCVFCGNTGLWCGRKLVLILDHENGIRNDNRLKNLRFVCPNCNSQLPTHCIGRVV